MAFHAAGAVDLAGVMKLSAFMGRAGSPRYNSSAPGSMIILGCSADAARELLAPIAGFAVVANINGPAQVVVAGEKPTLARLVAAAVARGIETRQLAVSHAFHSDLVAEGGVYMRASGPRLAPIGSGETLLYSCVEARPVPAGTSPLDHFADMVTRPVNFQSMVLAMADEVDLFLELGAGRVLSGLVQAIDPRVTCLPVEPIPGRSRAFHVALGALFAWGAPVRWDIVAMGLAPRG
jgi:enediyne polyketide synthase